MTQLVFALIGPDFFLIRVMTSVLKSTQKPTNNQADRQDQKEHQRPGKGDMPEQEIDIDLFAVLEGKDHNEEEENYGKNHFNIHEKLLQKRINTAPRPGLIYLLLFVSGT